MTGKLSSKLLRCLLSSCPFGSRKPPNLIQVLLKAKLRGDVEPMSRMPVPRSLPWTLIQSHSQLQLTRSLGRRKALGPLFRSKMERETEREGMPHGPPMCYGASPSCPGEEKRGEERR